MKYGLVGLKPEDERPELHEHYYDAKDRLENAWRISKLCNLLSEQGNNVIVATMSLFKEIHKWNRKNFNKYYEVYLDIPISELKKRDSKNKVKLNTLLSN